MSNVFVMHFLNDQIILQSDLEADTWVKLSIQECLLPPPGLATGEPDVLRPGIQKELQEQFHVYLMPSSKLDVFGECLLQVTHENIYLWDISNSKLKLVAWPLTALRRYGTYIHLHSLLFFANSLLTLSFPLGSDLTKFTFEAGRHCATGEGMFVFHTLEGEKIYRKVHHATLAIAEAHHKMKKHPSTLPIDLPQIETRRTGQTNSTSISCSRPIPSYALTADNSTVAHEEYENDFDNNDRTAGQFMRHYSHQTSLSNHRITQSNSPCLKLNTRCSLRASLYK